MISYETYKFLHLLFIVCFFMGATYLTCNSGDVTEKKLPKIITGILSFLIFVAGMGLIARLHFKHTEPFPSWIRLKIANWVILNALVVFLTKTKSKNLRKIFTFSIIICAAIGIWLAINKPI